MPEDRENNRPMVEAMERGPGPGRYKLPPTLGHREHDVSKRRDPAYSFGSKCPGPRDTIPGPGYAVDPALTRFGKDGTPKFSILGRHRDPKGRLAESFFTPAPGAYNPENVRIDRGVSAPSFSIGKRTRLRRCDKIPAPNSYHIPATLGPKIPHIRGAPGFSMAPRSDMFSAAYDLAKTPGPARYGSVEPNTFRTRSGQYSMQGRPTLPRDKTQIPGPGAYDPDKVNAHKPSVPRFSMGIRHSEYVMPVIVDVTD
ncbi:ciliary microtubule associated protein 1B-like [Tubulanus polymorphus]|uniref:ciliary microtubule associated protein 1B-like n=1 Tax=Tubulanus polymorphus TaxID=672921 RepID=UPI003DA586EE